MLVQEFGYVLPSRDTIYQGASGNMTRPLSRIRSFSKFSGSSRVGPGLFQKLLRRIGSGRVGSGGAAHTRPDPREVTRPLKASAIHEISCPRYLPHVSSTGPVLHSSSSPATAVAGRVLFEINIHSGDGAHLFQLPPHAICIFIESYLSAHATPKRPCCDQKVNGLSVV